MSYRKHQNLIKIFKLKIQKEFPGIRLFDRHVGQFLSTRFANDLIKGDCTKYDFKNYIISINKPGMADCYALLPSESGLIHLEFEFKTGNAVQSNNQKVWQKFIEDQNGIYIIVRDEYHKAVKELQDKIKRAGIILIR